LGCNRFGCFASGQSVSVRDSQKKTESFAGKFAIEMELTGNTVSCTIPLALIECSKGSLKPDMNVLLAGFGVGYSWAGCMMTSGNIRVFI
jgi:3-oxoacyl-[acyl-carrier-protein] synthase-3